MLLPRALGRCSWRRWSCCGWRSVGGAARPATPRGGEAPVAHRPGRERTKQLGGEGTAEVSEFAAAELGARIGRTTYSATASDRGRAGPAPPPPGPWARVVAGEVRASYARHVVSKTRHLSAPEAGFVDAELAGSADGRIPWTRFEELVAGKVAAAAPEVARAEEERARRATFAKIIGKPEHGMASFLIRAPIPGPSPSSTRPSGPWPPGWPSSCPPTHTPPTPARTVDGRGRPRRRYPATVTADERRVLAVLMLANPAADATALTDADLSALDTEGPVTAGGDRRPPRRPPRGPGRARPPDHRAGRGPRPGDPGLDPRRPRPARPVHHPPRLRPPGTSTGGCLRDPGPTSTGRATDLAGRRVPLLLPHQPHDAGRPHRPRQPTAPGEPARSGTTGR